MSSNFTDADDTSRFVSSAITLPHRSASPTSDFRGNHAVAAQSIPSVRPYSLRNNTLPSHHGQPPQCFDHQIFTTSYETQQLLAQTDMDIDHNRQQYDTAMMGDVHQQTPQTSFSSFPANSMLVHPATMGTAHGIGESGPPAAYHLTSMYKVKNDHTLTRMSNPEPQPFFSDASIDNMQPSYDYPSLNTNLALGHMQQPLTMGVENPTSANYYQVALPESTNTTNAEEKESSPYSRVDDGNTVHWRCSFSGCPASEDSELKVQK
ncbi:hypothetical protein M378DRAFT_181062 [Amanita muscaria Koide BX008]|uniref:Uncharacterized protein n=1 Tax=Amanita muscaria (strain Koide BX008) TaxID=946122 RepID=A0A0C2WRE7_AMAMK|nr:hypothetical protein M378DRAFT_181062 [Amanita muscaria Koide BX008]